MTSDVALQGDAALEQKRVQAKRLLAKQKLLNNSPSYGSLPATGGNENIVIGNTGETVSAPLGTAEEFSFIQNDPVFDTPSSTFEETGAQFEKQAAYVALVANAYGLVADDEVAGFVADRSRALASAQARQPEYMKEFNERWENSNGFFEGAGVILSSPRAIGRQVVTQSASAAIPLLAGAGGAKGGAATGAGIAAIGGQLGPQAAAPEELVTVPVAAGIGSVVGGLSGTFTGGTIVEVGAEIDGMLREAGVDVTDANQVLKALQNDTLMNDIKSKAERKGITTAAVDTLFQLVGGRFLKAAKVKEAGKIGTAAAGTADVAVQSVGEGVGEAAGQFAKDGQVDWKDAALEAVTSLGQSTGQTAIGTTLQGAPAVARQAKKQVVDIKNKIDAVEITDTTTDAEIDALETEISSAERDVISAVAENQIIALEAQQQAEIVAEAENLKAQIDSIPDVQVNKPSSFKEILGRTPETISQFIKKTGGIKDVSSELKARDITNKSMVGLITKENRTITTESGKITQDAQVDAVRERVFEAGFFPDKNDYNDISDSELFDAIANDVSGEKVYKFDDLQEINEIASGSQGSEQAFFERGIDRDSTVDDIVNVIRKERDLGKFTPRELIEIAPVAELETASDQFVEDVQEIKVDSYGLQSGSLLGGLGDFFRDFGVGVERLLTPISTRVRNIDKRLFMRLRKFEFNVKTQNIADNQQIRPFLLSLQKLDNETFLALDFALKNGQFDIVDEIAANNNIVEEVSAVKEVLDDIFDRAKSAGVDVEYRADFFPRRVNDVEGLIDHFKGSEFWNVIQEAIRARETKADRTLTNEERIVVINNLMRGFKVEGVSLAQKGVFKERTIEEITPQINQFYETSDQALINYISIANDAIETSKLFGKAVDINGEKDLSGSIGAFVNELSDAGRITTRQASTLKEVLNARFNEGRMGWITSAVRDLSYIDVMGSPLNALTQVGDLAPSMYNAGVVNALQTLPSSFRETGQINNIQDLGIDTIYEEFRNGSMTSKGVTKVFELTGLSKIDRVGKLTLVNSTLKKAKSRAQAGDAKLLAELEIMFEGDAQRVMNDLAEGRMNDDVKFYAFNTLLDFQPVAKSEMPEYYLRTGNLRILYMLKTFTVRQLDIYRREVISNLNTAARTGDAKLAGKAMVNFVRLAGFWIVMGSSADYLKDLLRSLFGGSEVEEPEDYVVDNMLKAFGFSRYQLNMVAKKGVTEVAGDMFLPPDKFFTNVQKDFKKLNKGELTLDNSKSIRSIPIGGELYYFWFGGGSGNADGGKKKSELLTR